MVDCRIPPLQSLELHLRPSPSPTSLTVSDIWVTVSSPNRAPHKHLKFMFPLRRINTKRRWLTCCSIIMTMPHRVIIGQRFIISIIKHRAYSTERNIWCDFSFWVTYVLPFTIDPEPCPTQLKALCISTIRIASSPAPLSNPRNALYTSLASCSVKFLRWTFGSSLSNTDSRALRISLESSREPSALRHWISGSLARRRFLRQLILLLKER